MSDCGDDVDVNSKEGVIKRVLKTAMANDGLVRGLHEVAKALDAGKVKCCFLAESCTEPAYTKLVEALCKEKETPLYRVSDSKTLGQWAGLCKYDDEGKPRKVVGATSVCITDWGEESDARAKLEQIMKSG
eukprot:GHVL01034085.1.p1 GENE.GHVL01034085.1~~GHVL01034085.1.p1  ORF type:complete len:131 (+),score=20.38 GHVL01034085.1:45-437(+)